MGGGLGCKRTMWLHSNHLNTNSPKMFFSPFAPISSTTQTHEKLSRKKMLGRLDKTAFIAYFSIIFFKTTNQKTLWKN